MLPYFDSGKGPTTSTATSCKGYPVMTLVSGALAFGALAFGAGVFRAAHVPHFAHQSLTSL